MKLNNKTWLVQIFLGPTVDFLCMNFCWWWGILGKQERPFGSPLCSSERSHFNNEFCGNNKQIHIVFLNLCTPNDRRFTEDINTKLLSIWSHKSADSLTRPEAAFLILDLWFRHDPSSRWWSTGTSAITESALNWVVLFMFSVMCLTVTLTENCHTNTMILQIHMNLGGGVMNVFNLIRWFENNLEHLFVCFSSE